MTPYYPPAPALRYSRPPRRRGGKARPRYGAALLEYGHSWWHPHYRDELRKLLILLDQLRAREQPSVKATIVKRLMAYSREDRRVLANTLGVAIGLDHRPLL